MAISANGPGPGPGEPGEPGDTGSTGDADGHGEDAAWRAIIDNYGERPVLEDPATAPRVEPAAEDELPPGDPARLRRLFEPLDRPAPPSADPAVTPSGDLAKAPDAPFVPPQPPPVPTTTAPRRAAWLGLLGSPAALLLSLLVGLDLPQVVAIALVASFVGGFLYLVGTMPRGPRDPGDDGARL